MIDTFKTFIPDLNGRLCLPVLTETQEHKKMFMGDKYHTGILNNLHVSVSATGVTIQGSLPKSCLGQNVTSMEMNDIRYALDEIGEILKLPIRDGYLRRVDIANTFVVEKSVPEYLARLGDIARRKRSDFANRSTISYKCRGKALTIYDKKAESLSKRGQIPDSLQGKNLLRIERSQTQTGQKVSALWNQGYIHKLVDEWVNDYFAIERRMIPEGFDASNLKSFENLVYKHGLYAIGIDTANDLVKSVCSQGDSATKKKGQRIRQRIREISAAGALKNDDILHDLDNQVCKAAEYWKLTA